MTTAKTPQDCRRLLVVAKPTFLKSVESAQRSNVPTNSTSIEILCYLEALLVLKHLQRPGVVQNLKVSKLFLLSINLFYFTVPQTFLHLDS